MTQIWQNDKVLAVTRIQAGPCPVIQLKTVEKDGYRAAQIGFGSKKAKNIAKPQRVNFELKIKNKEYNHPSCICEFRLDKYKEETKVTEGDIINIDTFVVGDKLQITGVSKGKGFQGVVKRHGFQGSKKTHGNKDQLRMPGSIGATGPAHVFKGTRMGGRMGGEKITTKNLEVVGVEKEKNEILIKGAVPGAINGFVFLAAPGELKVEKDEQKENIEKKEEDKKIDNSVETNNHLSNDSKPKENENK